ncbi:MAG TPA: N4-gp56 family major capsid protein, partial [Phycisphaerales bacterium]|nr:N4-gp56 family major capsid protein [Phycisphaerales bacterium]
MANITTTTQIDPGTSPFYDRLLLERAVPMFHHLKFADVKTLPKGESDSIKWRRYSALTVATAPLSEGVTPAGQQLGKNDLEARVQQYGDYVHLTDIVNLVNQDPIITETTEVQGEQMGETFDNLTRDYFAANASQTTCSNGTTGTSTDLNATDILGVIQTLL